jgi:hypothetical protein
MKRVVVGCGVALIIAACGGQTPPTGPTVSTPTSPSGPSSSGPPVPKGNGTVSGTVYDVATGQPLAGVSYSAWVDTESFGYSYMWATGPHQTDAGGHYQLVGLANASVRLQLWKDGYEQQCASPPLSVAGSDTTMDAQMVPTSQLFTTSAPWMASPGTRVVSGTAYLETNGVRTPAPGAFVDFEPLEDFPAAVTTSDSQGHYLLCGLPSTASAYLSAAAAGQVTYLTVPAGQTTGVDIVIK